MIIGLEFLLKNLRNVNRPLLYFDVRARLTDFKVQFRDGAGRRVLQNANKPLLRQTNCRKQAQHEDNRFFKIQTDILFLANAESENYFKKMFNCARK